MAFEEFPDGHRGGQLGYQNGMILAILNLCVTVMPLIKFWLNRTYGLGGDVVWRVSRWPPGHLGYPNGKILAILNLCVTLMPPIKFWLNPTNSLGEMSFEEFQNGRRGGHFWSRNGTILAILNLCVTVMPPIKFWLNPTYGLGGDVV